MPGGEGGVRPPAPGMRVACVRLASPQQNAGSLGLGMDIHALSTAKREQRCKLSRGIGAARTVPCVYTTVLHLFSRALRVLIRFDA